MSKLPRTVWVVVNPKGYTKIVRASRTDAIRAFLSEELDVVTKSDIRDIWRDYKVMGWQCVEYRSDKKLTALEFMQWKERNFFTVLKNDRIAQVVSVETVSELFLSMIKDDERKRWTEGAKTLCPVEFEEGEG